MPARTLRALIAALLLMAPPTVTPVAQAGVPVDRAAPLTEPGAAPAAEVAGTEERVRERLGAGRVRAKIVHPGATYVKVHFADLSLRSGDYVTVSRPDGEERRTYRGSARDRWAMSVDGPAAVVKLHTKSRDTASTVTVDRVARGFTAEERAARSAATPLSICGNDDSKDAVCYESSHPAEYTGSRAVARLLIGGTSACTGWRVGENNRMFTNNHCFSSTGAARDTEVQFNYDCPTCGGTGSDPVTKVMGDEVLRTSASLDYTLFTVQDFDTIGEFGHLSLDPRTPETGEEIYIAGHPAALTKKLSIESDVNGGNCQIDQAITGINTGYRCDTQGGSSGSPVFARSSHQVIAIHRLGGCPNGGVRMELVFPEVEDLL